MSKKYFKFIILFALVLFLSVGYAVVSSVNLTITGSATGETREVDVKFLDNVSVSKPSYVTVNPYVLSFRTASAVESSVKRLENYL